MAFDAILIIDDVGFNVNGRHIRSGMIVTAIARVGDIVGDVAHLAIGIFALVAVIDRKSVFDQTRRLPTGNGMARGAIFAELSEMHLGIRMARDAIFRRAFETIIDVAFGAGDLGMFAGECVNGLVIKALQSIRAVVTGDTRLAHLFAMIGDIFRVMRLVAIDARRSHGGGLDLGIGRCRGVAGATRQSGIRVIALMVDERKAELVVRETIGRDARQRGVAPFMLGVTRRAILGIAHLGMNAARAGDLLADIGMTFFAEFRRGSLKRRVAQVTLRLKIGVRREIGEWLVIGMFQTECTRRKRRTTREHERAQQNNDEKYGCATTQRRAQIFRQF